MLKKTPFLATFLLTMIFSRCSNNKETVRHPNILFCISDDQSFPHASAYGCEFVNTPGFDKVAKEGLLFTNAYTPNAKCAPSRSSILTGRNSWQLEEAGNHNPVFPSKFKTYVEELQDNGYFVGYTGKGWSPGIQGTINGSPRLLTGKEYSEIKQKSPTGDISNKDYAKNFKRFLSDNTKEQPWCFWYGSHEPHRRYEFQSGVIKGGKKLDDINKVFSYWPDNDSVRNDILDYAFEIEHFDQHLSQMLAYLEEIGELENTLIVVTSDNGMPFPRIKGQEYEHSNHLPMAIMWKNGIKKPGRIVKDLVSFIDLAPTFLEVAGIPQTERQMLPITGKSLMSVFRNRPGQNEYLLIGKERHDFGRPNNEGYPIRGVVKDGFLYLHNFKIDRWPSGNPETGYLNTDGGATKSWILNDRRKNGESKYWDYCFGKRTNADELYDINSDPDCMINLAMDKEYLENRKALKELLFEKLIEQGDPRMFGNGDVFDQYPYASESSWNFYEKYMSGDRSLKTTWVNDSDYEPEIIE